MRDLEREQAIMNALAGNPRVRGASLEPELYRLSIYRNGHSRQEDIVGTLEQIERFAYTRLNRMEDGR